MTHAIRADWRRARTPSGTSMLGLIVWACLHLRELIKAIGLCCFFALLIYVELGGGQTPSPWSLTVGRMFSVGWNSVALTSKHRERKNTHTLTHTHTHIYAQTRTHTFSAPLTKSIFNTQSCCLLGNTHHGSCATCMYSLCLPTYVNARTSEECAHTHTHTHTHTINVKARGRFKEDWNGPKTTLPTPARNKVAAAELAAWKIYTVIRSHMSKRTVRRESRYFPGLPVRSEGPVHSFCLLAWEIWLMTWQRSSMQIANICHSASSSPYIYLLILLNISAYYWLFVGGGQWCMFLHDGVQKKAISCNSCIRSCCFF